MSQVKSCVSFAVLLMLFMFQLATVKSAPTVRRNATPNQLNRTKRGVTTIFDGQRWKDGIVPYELAPELKPHQCLIETAMMDIMLKSCIFFRPRRPDDRYSVRIHQGKGCYAKGVGKTQDGEISLGTGCHYTSVVLHELMHTIGFEHEHHRSDRDQYIKINHENVKENGMSNFIKNHKYFESRFGEFDFDSIMLYGDTFYSNSKVFFLTEYFDRVTIEPVAPGKRLVQAKRLSPLDIKAINTFYQCDRVDKKACEKMEIFHRLFPYCFFEASKVLHWSFIDPMKKQCQESSK